MHNKLKMLVYTSLFFIQHTLRVVRSLYQVKKEISLEGHHEGFECSSLDGFYGE